MVSDEAVVWQPIQMTLIHRFPGITVFKYCVGASNLTPLLSSVSSERTCRIRSRLLFKKKALFRHFVHQSMCCCFRSKCNARTRTLKFATTPFYANISLCSSSQSITICITLHYFIFLNHKSSLLTHLMKLDCVTKPSDDAL